ncbi:MAG: COX15/CtaA family protein [Mesonia hippocampi]|uniref:COX15/CtaA family protein n=1 Tax=Mesonia hippocampi TaxID=1628250 RepID=UPI003F9AD638
MFRKIVKTTLVLVYLVIIAGATVRMTGSGMGCPDWPKCFGYYIPPTEQSQLEWHPEHQYKKGQVIILNETLQVANSSFTSTKTFNKNNWSTYTKHDYAIFNPTHTWVEYINRLFGALSGIAVLVMAIASFRKWRINKKITLLSWLNVFLMGFQAWLGATVVYSHLAPLRITIHMVVALVIVALILYILHLASKTKKTTHRYNKQLRQLFIWAAVITLIQVVLGTEVRAFIDFKVKDIGYQKEHWLANPDFWFYIHRSFSILVVVFNLYIWYFNKKIKANYKLINWVVTLIFIEIITGLAMYHFHFPFSTQAIHLVIASVLFGLQYYLVLQIKNAKNLSS